MTLNKIDYYNKLISLQDISKDRIKDERELEQFEQSNKLYKSMYESYVQELGPELTDDGFIDLEETKYLPSSRGVGNSNFASGWIIFPNLTTYLIKSNISLDDEENKKWIYNNIVAYKLSKQIDIPVAEYLIATDKLGENILISQNFLNDNEELISGDSIVKRPKNIFKQKDINSMEYVIEQIDKWCKLRNFPMEQIEHVKKDFIKQSLFNKILNRTDETNRNFGLIVSKGNVRLAPGFDYDHSFSTMKIPPVRKTVRGNDSSIEGFVKYYGEMKWFRDWIPELISNINIEEIIKDINLPDISYVYRNMITENLKELNNAYHYMESDLKDNSRINDER